MARSPKADQPLHDAIPLRQAGRGISTESVLPSTVPPPSIVVLHARRKRGERERISRHLEGVSDALQLGGRRPLQDALSPSSSCHEFLTCFLDTLGLHPTPFKGRWRGKESRNRSTSRAYLMARSPEAASPSRMRICSGSLARRSAATSGSRHRGAPFLLARGLSLPLATSSRRALTNCFRQATDRSRFTTYIQGWGF